MWQLSESEWDLMTHQHRKVIYIRRLGLYKQVG